MTAPRSILFIIFASAFISSCQTPGMMMDALTVSQGSVEKRQIESRPIEVKTDKILIQTIVATLQDFGFKIEELQEWGKNKKLLWSSYQNIKNFDYDNISDKIYLTVNNFVNDQTYSYDKFASVSQAIAQLYDWLKAVNEY